MEQVSLLERLRRWWRSRWWNIPPLTPPPPSSSQAPTTGYEVKDQNDQVVAHSETLQEAHQQWQNLTDSKGTITNLATGEDVTPEPDDKGRYVVLDQDRQQLGSFDDLAVAEQAWQELTDGKGRIIDVQDKRDITPKSKFQLTSQQLHELGGLIAGKGYNNRHLEVDPDVVAEFARQIARLEVPIFVRTNLVGKGTPEPTKTVPIKRREVRIEKVRKKVEIEVKGKPKPGGRIFVPYATEESDVERMRTPSDIRFAPRSELALPSALFRRKIATKSLHRRVNIEEAPGTPTVRKRLVWQEFEEPKVHEWTENVEVTEDEKAQIVESLLDVSGSMDGSSINLAVALATVVVSGHLDDDSRYLYRQFGTDVGPLTEASTPAQKRKMVGSFLRQNNSYGGGTEIMKAVVVAAADVRARAKSDQAPEVLLITDGDDYVSSELLYAALGRDVTLHTVVVNGRNQFLKDRSTTYYELSCDETGTIVSGSDGSNSRFSTWY